MGLVGCITPATQRGVIDNQVFYSTGMPKIKVTLADKSDRVFNHKDRKIKKFSSGRGSYTIDTEQHVFLNLDGNQVKNGVAIEHRKMNDGYWLPDVLAGIKRPLESGKIIVDGEKFHFAYGYITSNLPLNKPIIDKIDKTDIILPNHFFVKTFGRRVGANKRVKIYISYFENLNYYGGEGYPNNEWKNTNLMGYAQREIIKAAKKRADEAFTISHKLESSEPAVSVQSDPIQSKLGILKQSYEADLITKEEYETKKSALLDAL